MWPGGLFTDDANTNDNDGDNDARRQHLTDDS